MIKKIALILLIIFIFVATLWFNNNNSELISINLEVIQFTSSASIMFAVILFTGWFFGVLSCSLYILKLLNERRVFKSLMKEKIKEIELLRQKPLEDAN